MKVSGKIGNGPLNKRLNFGGSPDSGKMCFGRGMHCPSASSVMRWHCEDWNWHWNADEE